MNKDSISDCLGIGLDNPNYPKLIGSKVIDVLSKEETISEVLLNLGSWSKMENFFSEEKLTPYEKELLFIGYVVGLRNATSSQDSLTQLEKMVELMERVKKVSKEG
jgi:hypothetical protein